MKINNLFVAIVIMLAFSSCTMYKGFTTYQNIGVNLNAYNNGENISSKKVALLVCNDERIPKHDLKNLELERYIKKMLEPKGYTFTSNNSDANIVIFYEYGVSDPKVYTSQQVVPVWGQTGISSSRTETKTAFGKSYLQTTYTPSYGVVSSNVVTNTKITYVRWVNMSALDADYYRKTGEDKMLWLTEIRSEGESDDLRYIFPYMMVAAREYIGQNRTNKITVQIPSNPADKRVLDLKGTLATVVINEATTGRKALKASIYEDVYVDGSLFIKAGTPVKVYQKRTDSDIILSNFQTTSVYGNNVLLKGGYRFEGKVDDNMFFAGTIFTFLIITAPIGIPLWCFYAIHAKIPEGTLLYLEIE